MSWEYWTAGGHGWRSYGYTLHCPSGAVIVSRSYKSWTAADEALQEDLAKAGYRVCEDGSVTRGGEAG